MCHQRGGSWVQPRCCALASTHDMTSICGFGVSPSIDCFIVSPVSYMQSVICMYQSNTNIILGNSQLTGRVQCYARGSWRLKILGRGVRISVNEESSGIDAPQNGNAAAVPSSNHESHPRLMRSSSGTVPTSFDPGLLASAMVQVWATHEQCHLSENNQRIKQAIVLKKLYLTPLKLHKQVGMTSSRWVALQWAGDH